MGKPVPTHTHYGHRGLLHVLMGTVHTYMGKCPQAQYSYLQRRVSTLFIGHIDSCIHALVTSQCIWEFLVPLDTAHTGPLVLGPPAGPQTQLAFVQTLRSPYLWVISNLCPPATVIPCFPVCPATQQPAHDFGHATLFVNIPIHSAGLAFQSGLAPCSHPASQP